MSLDPKPGVVIFSKEVASLSLFYDKLFLLVLKHNEPEKVVLESDSFMLVIHGIPQEIASSINITCPPDIRKNTAIKMFLPVRSIADARLDAASLGGAIKSVKYEWSAANFKACDGYDPEGNVIQVRECAP